MSQTFDLDDQERWPHGLLEYLQAYRQILEAFQRQPSRESGQAFDEAIYRLRDVLNRYSLVGWHCTRLTEAEMAAIKERGMQLPDLGMLHRRILAVEQEGLIGPMVANRLRAENQAHESNRAGMIWFCFFPPHRAGEHGIGRFFRSWGGEALYNSHEDDPETGAALGTIGIPCLVEAVVPIASLDQGPGLALKIARRFLQALQPSERLDHADSTVRPIPRENIRQIVRFPASEFRALTECDDWNEPIA